MRGIKSITLLVVILMALSGCSIFVAQEGSEDEICVPKSKLEELGISVEELLAEDEPAVEPSAEQTEGGEEESSEEMQPEEETESSEEVSGEEIPVRTFTAGDLVQVSPQAQSDVVFTYSEPLDRNGMWQTTRDDAGEYVVEVTATNNVGSITKQLKLVIMDANAAPVISGLEDVTVDAGETVRLSPEVSDPDGDEVVITFSGWMDESKKDTTKEDVGEHSVTVKATDGKLEAQKTVKVTVLKVNNKPVLSDINGITVKEGDLVSIDARAVDPDGDEVEIEFSAPLDKDGEWQTEKGDAGSYLITVTASDGELEDEKKFSIVVEEANNAPEINIESIFNYVVAEGSSKDIVLEPVVSDADGDEVTVTYSGFMTSEQKTLTEEDEGSHTVTITVTDGKATVSKDVTIIVEVNSPPEFTF